MTPPNDTAHASLIRNLADDLAPVRRLPTPSQRTLLWLAAVALIACFGALLGDLPALGRRLSAAPDMWLAVAGSALTAILAAFAAFQLSLPDRSRAYALLPLPAAVVWIVASGLGCLRTSLIAGTHAAGLSEERDCLLIILGLSIPLSAFLILMLRRAYTLQPVLTAMTAGLAAAAAAATLLNFFHPYDATASDLVVHAVAVAIVVAVSSLIGRRSLAVENLRLRT